MHSKLSTRLQSVFTYIPSTISKRILKKAKHEKIHVINKECV